MGLRHFRLRMSRICFRYNRKDQNFETCGTVPSGTMVSMVGDLERTVTGAAGWNGRFIIGDRIFLLFFPRDKIYEEYLQEIDP